MRSPLAGLPIALRSLARHRTFTVAAVLTLALGMGAATAIFTLLDRVVLQPLPYPEPDRLVRLKNPVPGVGAGEEWELSTAQYFYFTEHARSLEAVGLFQQGAGLLAGEGGSAAQRVQVAAVTAPTLRLLGAHAVRGRDLGRSDDAPGAPAVAVISQGFWQRQFGGAGDVLGRSIHLNGQTMQIVGVMAPGVELPGEPGQSVPIATDVWITRQLNPAGPFANNHVNPAIARLAPGVTIAAAQAELDRLTPELPRVYPSAYSEAFLTRYKFHTTLQPLKRYVVGKTAAQLWMLFGAVGLVLLIACANVANLMLVRLEARRREFAVRSALGAHWRQLALDAFREGALLAVAGGVLAIGIAAAGVRWLVSLAPPGIPRLENLHLDAVVLLFAAVLAALVAALIALVPVVQLRGGSALPALGDGGRSVTAGVARQRARGALVVSQVALALVLVVASGLLLRSFERLRAVNPGVQPTGVLTVELYLPRERYDSAYKSWQFQARAMERIRALPGVTAVGLSEEIPFTGGYGCTVQGFEDQAVFQRIKDAGLTTCAGQELTSPGYFRAMGIPLLAGRDFTAGDNDHPETGAVIVSKAFADRFWPGENAIGKGVGPGGWNATPYYHVVGVVGDVHAATVTDAPAIAIYYPLVPDPNVRRGWLGNGMTLVVRGTGGDPLSLLPAVRRTLAELDPAVPLANANDMSTIVARSMSQLTFTMTLLGIAGLTALLLAAVGLYGVISYVVARRTNEMGVRLALGARPGQVRALVVTGALRLALLGVTAGTIGALVFARVLRGLLYGVAPWDPASYTLAVLVLAGVAALAAWIPARRAAAIDPAVALRTE